MIGSVSSLAKGLLALASIHASLAIPIKGIERAKIEQEYDFVIAGGTVDPSIKP